MEDKLDRAFGRQIKAHVGSTVGFAASNDHMILCTCIGRLLPAVDAIALSVCPQHRLTSTHDPLLDLDHQ